jgi:hypothetical protein
LYSTVPDASFRYWRCGRSGAIPSEAESHLAFYRLGAAGFESALELSTESGDSLTTALLPGLAFPLAHAFA